VLAELGAEKEDSHCPDKDSRSHTHRNEHVHGSVVIGHGVGDGAAEDGGGVEDREGVERDGLREAVVLAEACRRVSNARTSKSNSWEPTLEEEEGCKESTVREVQISRAKIVGRRAALPEAIRLTER